MMQYLVFGILLILGAACVGLSVYVYHLKNKVTATVLESHSDIKKNGQYIESIIVSHVLEIDSEVSKNIIETEVLPVREIKGAKLPVHYDKKMQKFYVPDYHKYVPLVFSFFICGAACFLLYVIQEFRPAALLPEAELVAVLLALVTVVSCSYSCAIIHPAVVKTKGSFEAFLKPEDGSEEAEIYCLWYGEHRQYAKRTKGIRFQTNPEKTVTLFYNTKTGVVYRLHEFLLSMCLSIAAFAGMVVILIV